MARALHKHSPRSSQPFIALNTAAIPKDLLESELFGHERGAFTGAQATRRGRFEQAEGGTLFLDEIGDMPFELQTRLLRVLSDGQFYRVGGHEAVKSQVRVIAATHQDLEARVRAGQFREDLFHRLNVIRLRLPPLRERAQDIPSLARHFLRRSADSLGVEPKHLSETAQAVLGRFAFPGNVRQLENLCHWLTVMAPGQEIQMEDLPPEVLSGDRLGQAAGPLPGLGGAMTPAMPAATGLASGVTAGGAGQLPQAGSSEVDLHDLSASPAGLGVRPRSPEALDWESALQAELRARLQAGEPALWDELIGRAEDALLQEALKFTHGRRVEAAKALGIGRNTLTRKLKDKGDEMA